MATPAAAAAAMSFDLAADPDGRADGPSNDGPGFGEQLRRDDQLAMDDPADSRTANRADNRARSTADAASDGDDDEEDDHVRRNPPRDWAAPPPWLASNGPPPVDAEPPAFLGRRASEPGQGLAGSAADRMAGGGPAKAAGDEEDAAWSAEARPVGSAALGASAAAAERGRSGARRSRAVEPDEPEEGANVGTPRRPRAYAQHLGGPDGPDWERPRRYEAYPTIKRGVSMPGLPAVPRIVGLAAIVVVAALALFFLPGILNIGGGGSSGTPRSSSSPAPASTGPSASLAPTEPPAPTASTYTIKQNDTLLKIANAHGITLAELMAANPAIKNPNKISVGQQITLPPPSSAAPDTIGGSAAP